MRPTWVEMVGDQVVRIFKSSSAAMRVPNIQTKCVLYRSQAVAAIRHSIWLRCKGECEICAAPITEQGGHMHEQKHRGQGGEISLANSVFICPKCHQRAHGDRNPRWKNSMEKRLDIQKGFRQSSFAIGEDTKQD